MRDYDDPQYVEWRAAVRRRDGYKCQMPGCGSRKKLKCHHIMPWSKYPHMRFLVDNGITICREHHDRIRGYEHLYANAFNMIVKRNSGDDKNKN